MKQEKFVVKLPFELWNLLSLRMILKNESSELYIFIFNVLFKKKKKKKKNRKWKFSKKCPNIMLHNLFKLSKIYIFSDPFIFYLN